MKPVSRGRKEVDITVINVRVFSFRPPVGQVKQLMREERSRGFGSERDFLGKCVARASSFDHRQCQDPQHIYFIFKEKEKQEKRKKKKTRKKTREKRTHRKKKKQKQRNFFKKNYIPKINKKKKKKKQKKKRTVKKK